MTIFQAQKEKTIKEILKSIPEEFYYWIGIALFYLLSAVFKKRQQQDGNLENNNPDNKQSFLQRALQADSMNDLLGDIRDVQNNREVNEEKLFSDENIEADNLMPEWDEESSSWVTNKSSDDIDKDLSKPLDILVDSIKKNDIATNEAIRKAPSAGYSNRKKSISILDRLDIKNKDDLKNAIIINEILSRPRAMKKQIR